MLGDNVVSTLLGGGNVSLIAEAFDDLIRAMNFPGAAALASLMVLFFVALAVVIRLLLRRRGGSGDVFAGLRA